VTAMEGGESRHSVSTEGFPPGEEERRLAEKKGNSAPRVLKGEKQIVGEERAPTTPLIWNPVSMPGEKKGTTLSPEI